MVIERLVISTGKTDFLVADQLQQKKNLIDFLQHFSKRTLVFPTNSIEFVDELHRRGIELHLNMQPIKNVSDQPANEVDTMQSGAIFSVMSVKIALPCC